MSASNVIPLARYMEADRRAYRALCYQTLIKYCGDAKKCLPAPEKIDEKELIDKLAAALAT